MGAMLGWLGQLKRKASREREGFKGTAFAYFILLIVATFAYLALISLA